MSFVTLLLPLALYCFPLAVYCLILAFLNRSQHPVLVRGTWDLVGLLFAGSGFLLFGGPDILRTLYENQRSAYALKQPHFLDRYGEAQWLFWVSLWGLYFGLVVGSAVYLLRQRRRMTAIYNVDPAVFEEVLTRVLDWRLPSYSRNADEIRLENETVVVELDPFPALRHVTLYWREGTGELRRAIEAELTAQLAQVRSGYNPTGGWLLSLAACLFCGTFFSLLLLMATVILRFAQ